MVDYGMTPAPTCSRAATAGNAAIFGLADRPAASPRACSPTWSRSRATRPATSPPLRRVRFVMKDGAVVLQR